MISLSLSLTKMNVMDEMCPSEDIIQKGSVQLVFCKMQPIAWTLCMFE